MKTMTDGRRQGLAAAITARNGAAVTFTAAETALAAAIGGNLRKTTDGMLGDRLDDLVSQHWAARRRVEGLEDEMREARQRHGEDRVALNKHFMAAHDGRTGDELIAEAKANEAEAARRRAAMEVERDKLAAVYEDTAQALSYRKRDVSKAIDRLFEDEVETLTAGVSADMTALYLKIGALTFASSSIDMQHRDIWQAGHRFHETRNLLKLFESFRSGEILERRNAGALPWQAARARLEVDAGAPLPTDPPARKAAA